MSKLVGNETKKARHGKINDFKVYGSQESHWHQKQQCVGIIQA